MKTNNCEYCGEKLENCICPNVARFFKDNGHLMEDKEGQRVEQTYKKRFFYVKGVNLLLNQ